MWKDIQLLTNIHCESEELLQSSAVVLSRSLFSLANSLSLSVYNRPLAIAPPYYQDSNVAAPQCSDNFYVTAFHHYTKRCKCHVMNRFYAETSAKQVNQNFLPYSQESIFLEACDAFKTRSRLEYHKPSTHSIYCKLLVWLNGSKVTCFRTVFPRIRIWSQSVLNFGRFFDFALWI